MAFLIRTKLIQNPTTESGIEDYIKTRKQGEGIALPSPEVIAADDIVLRFTRNGVATGYGIRIASRHGHQTMPSLIEGIRPYLADGVEVPGSVETPSRFAP